MELRRALAVEAGDRARREGLADVGNEQVGIEVRADAEAVAVGTGAVRAVEGEQARAELRERDAAVGAGEAPAEEQLLGDGIAFAETLDAHQVAAVLERDLERVGEALLEPGAHRQPVDQHLDGVRGRAREHDVVGEVAQLAVDRARARSPPGAARSSSLRCSPLRPRTTGA